MYMGGSWLVERRLFLVGKKLGWTVSGIVPESMSYPCLYKMKILQDFEIWIREDFDGNKKKTSKSFIKDPIVKMIEDISSFLQWMEDHPSLLNILWNCKEAVAIYHKGIRRQWFVWSSLEVVCLLKGNSHHPVIKLRPVFDPSCKIERAPRREETKSNWLQMS